MQSRTHAVKGNTGENWVAKALESAKRGIAPLALTFAAACAIPAYAQQPYVQGMPANMEPPVVYTYNTHGRYESGKSVYDVDVTLYCDGIKSGRYFLSGCLTDRPGCVADPQPPNNCLSWPAVQHAKVDSIYMVNPNTGNRTRIYNDALIEEMHRRGIMVSLPDLMYKISDGVSIFVYPCQN